MPRIYTRQLKEGWITLVRGAGTLIGAGSTVIVADNSTLTDANIPPAQSLDCCGYDSIFVGCNIAGGTNPSLTVEALFRDSEAADGSRWRRLLAGAREGLTAVASPAALETVLVGTGTAPVTFAEIRVFGHRSVFLRISAVANPGSTTGYELLVKPGRIRPSNTYLQPVSY
jgi:hypothetical protein